MAFFLNKPIVLFFGGGVGYYPKSGFVHIGSFSTWPLKLSLLSAFSVAAFQLLFFNAVHQAGVAVGTIVGLGSAPIFAGVLVFVVFGERPGRRWLFATLLSITGCSLLLLAGREAPVAILL